MRQVSAVAVSLFFFLSTAASAATYYVSPSGNDAANGAIDTPFKTIKQASRIAKPGDVVNVRTGIYPDQTSISSKGTAGAMIVFRAMPGETPILDGSTLPANTDILTLNGTDYVEFSGFEVRNSTKSAVVLWRASHTNVVNNHIHHNQLNGIYVGGDITPSGVSVTVSGNNVHDCALMNQYHTLSGGGWPGAVVVSRTDNATITGNHIWNNDGEGLISLRSNYHVIEANEISNNYSMNLYFDNSRFAVVNGNLIFSSNSRYYRNGKPAAGIGVANETKDVMNPSSDNVFTNNIVIGTRWGFYYGNYESGGGLRNSKVLNNTFYGTADSIIQIENGTHSNSVIENNIFFATTSPTPTLSGAGSGVTYANNLWYGGNAGAAAGAGDVLANPVLANAGGLTSADYKIRVGSAAVAKAINVSDVVKADYFGALRATPLDIGAHQLTAVSTGDTTAPSIPANLRATGGDNSSASIAWNASTDNVGVTGYAVIRNGVTVATVTGTSWTDRTVSTGTLYAYQVQALDAAGNRSALTAALSLAWSSSEAALPLGTPVLTLASRTATTVTLQWKPVQNAVAFRVSRNGVVIATTSSFDYTNSGLTPLTVYSYSVVAVDATGKVSAASNPVSVQTTAAGKSHSAHH